MRSVEIRPLRESDFHEIGNGKPIPAGSYPAYTLVDMDGAPLAACGIVLAYEGVGEVWALLSSRGKSFGRVPVEMKKIFQKIVKEYGLRRVQAHVNTRHTVSVRFAQWIGMKYEGTCRKCGLNGEDFDRYAWIRED